MTYRMKRTSITITPEHMEWLKKTGYKPTSLLRVKIQEIQNKDKLKTFEQEIKNLKRRIVVFENFIENKGFLKDFFEYEKEFNENGAD